MAPEQYFLIEQEICYVICHEFQFDSNMFYCWQFLLTVDPVDAPGYYKVIKNPMDFGTIRVKLEVSQITFESLLLLTIMLQHNGTILWLCYFEFIYFLIFGCKETPREQDLEYLKFLLLLHKSNLKHLTYHLIWMLFSDWKVPGVFRISCWHDVSENKLFKVQPTWARCATGQWIIMLVLDSGKLNFSPTPPSLNPMLTLTSHSRQKVELW